MKKIAIMALAATAAAGALALSGQAFADNVVATGTVSAVCGVAVSNPALNLGTLNLQRIADLNVQCNNKTNPHLTVAAANGALKNGTIAIGYSWGVDLQGQVNSTQTPQVNGSTTPYPIGLISGQELATGVPGHMTMMLKSLPWAAGTYSETFTLTVG